LKSTVKALILLASFSLAFVLPPRLLALLVFVVLLYSKKLAWKVAAPVTLYVFATNYIFFGLDKAVTFSLRVLFLITLTSAFRFSFRDVIELPLPKSVYIPILVARRFLKLVERDARMLKEAHVSRFGEVRVRDYVNIYATLLKLTMEKVNEVAVAIYLKEDGIESYKRRLQN